MRRRFFCQILSFSLLCPGALAQGFLARYQARVTSTQAAQPRWVTPLVTITPRLEQELRTDFTRQRNAAGYDTWSLGGGKGPETIPFGPLQITLNLPPFLDHTEPGKRDGFGDLSVLLKYRMFSRNEEHGNAIATFFLGASVPTGKNANGLCCAVVLPTLALGRGWGLFDVVTTAGGTLPVTNARGLGHTIAWNTTLQYHVAKTGKRRFLWPELESNTAFFRGGPNDGNVQSFLTPGLMIGRLPLSRDAAGNPKRLALTFGMGEQIAVRRFHTYNHALVVSIRVPF